MASRRVHLSAAIGLIAAAAATASVVAAPGLRGMLGATLALTMLAIAIVDARRFIIPDELVAVGLGLGLVHAALAESDTAMQAVAMAAMRGVAMALVLLSISAVYSRLRQRQGIGLGDVKLAGVAGIWLGWSTIPIAFEIAALVALASYALRQRLLRRPIRSTSRLPFGLFLAPAIWLCWLFDVTLLAPF